MSSSNLPDTVVEVCGSIGPVESAVINGKLWGGPSVDQSRPQAQDLGSY